jgi:hypothetical protein
VAYREEREGDVVHRFWETPRGELRETRRWNAEQATSFVLEYPVKGVADFRALAARLGDERWEIDPAGVGALRARAELTGEDGILTLSLPGTPLGDLVRVYMGAERLAYECADHPAELGDLLAAMEDNYLRRLRLAVSLPADAVISYDDTSTTTISPRMFEEWEMPYIRRATAIAHAAGRLYIHHSCGHVRDLLALYARTPMDAVDSLNMPPTGNVSIGEAKARLGRGIVMLPTFVQVFGSMKDRDAVRRSVRRMFEEAAPGDNFVPILVADRSKTMADTELILEEARKHTGRVG